MRKIYIILTHTGTILSRIIRKYTKDEFTHVSIALDNSLENMYSFGRLNPYNPFWGGFVCEHIDSGTFKRFYKTVTRVYALDVTEEQYENVKKIIMIVGKNKNNYKFNVLGLFAVGFNKKISKANHFYCAEFIKYIMETAKINQQLPDLIKPESFKLLYGAEPIYNGLLKKYVVQI